MRFWNFGSHFMGIQILLIETPCSSDEEEDREEDKEEDKDEDKGEGEDKDEDKDNEEDEEEEECQPHLKRTHTNLICERVR